MVFMGLVELLKEQSRARLERTRALITGGDAARAAPSCSAPATPARRS